MSNFFWESDDWVPFLTWLSEERGSTTAEMIIQVVDKPYKWENTFFEWLVKEREVAVNKPN